MNNELEKASQDVIQKLVLDGDISKMTPQQKVIYYNQFCHSLGLNPLTQPFQIIVFQGKQRLYATKDCTEQLRKIHGVSITDVSATELRGVYVVTAKAQDKTGKTDAATGVVNIEGLKGDALANALMKAETKAKRRVTLSICGLGMLDESEMDTMKGATTEDVPHIEVNDHLPFDEPADVPQTPVYEKPWLSQKDLNACLVRIQNGEQGVYDNANLAFRMKKEYRQQLIEATREKEMA